MTPRNQRLINEVAVGIVYVQGPTSETSMTIGDLVDAHAEIQDGLSMLAGLEPDARMSWVHETRVIELDQPIFPTAPWKGLPKNFYVKRIDAALWRESNQKTYLFQGDQYVRLTGSTMDAGYPKPIAGHWHGLPPDFEDGIDAAFWHKQRDKIYMFKGDQYVRLTETTMDAGYPKPIAGNWNDVPAGFESGIDAVFMRHTTNKIYMFQGDQYVRLTGSTMDAGYPKPIAGNFKGLPEHYEEGIDAALWRGDNDKVYFFDSPPRNNLNDYIRYSDDFNDIDAGYPKWVGGLDAGETEALWRDPALADLGFGPGADGYKAYADDLQNRHETKSSIVAFITKYPVYWGGYAGTPRLVMAWKVGGDNFDRVFAHETGHLFGAPDEYGASNCSCGSSYGRFFRVKNGNCRLCAGAISMDGGYPTGINGPWQGLPAAFQSGIDAAIWRPSNQKVYMFKDDQYVRMTGTTVDPGYPQPIAGNWNGLPASFEAGIDAAVWRASNGKIYFFKGSQYVRMTGADMDTGYPQPIAGNWKGLNASFNAGIDAAVWRPSNGKIYFFKGNQYARLTDTEMDAGYPTSISGNWKELPASFTSGIDAALWHADKEKIYLFKGNQYARMSNGVACLMSSNVAEVCGYTPSHLGWEAFMARIDASVYRGDNNKTYLFSREWYARFSTVGGEMDEGYPKLIRNHWHGLPSSFHRDLDAALWRESNQKTYLFKGNQYVRLTGSTMDDGYPKPIAGHWKGIPDDFEDGIDAALWRQSNDKIYLFRGDRYVRLTETEMDSGYPQPIAPNWTGAPGSFANGIDAALMRQDTGQIYFFNGRTYLRYSNVADGVDPGYPKWIDGPWMPFPR